MRTSEILTAGQAGVEQLHEQNAGRVFAYCYARVGSRNVAEWAVNATFDRARAALGNGGIPEPELDWLLRTADKFCAPKLCLDARPLESMVVLQDWRGRSFDEIANELEARYARLEEERSRLTPWRRILGAFNFGPALSWIKGLVGALGTAKATVAVVAVVGAIAVASTPLRTRLQDVVRSDSARPPASAQTPQGSGAASSGAVVTPGLTQSGRQATPRNVGAADIPKNGARVHASAGGAGAASPTSAHQTGNGPSRSQTGDAPESRSGAATTSGVSASSSVTTTPKVPALANTPALPGVSTPTVTAATPGTSLPQVPSTPAAAPIAPAAPTVPTVETPTLPSVDTSTTPNVDTPTLPGADPPTAPGPPSTPTLPTAPSSSPSPPAVTVPSTPPVNPPTVTLPK